MSIQEINADEVYRAICDGPGCGVPALYETTATKGANGALPYTWYRIALGGHWVHFHAAECVGRWLLRLSVEQRDTGGGWLIGSIVKYITPEPTRAPAPPPDRD